MLMFEDSVSFLSRKSIISMAYLIPFILSLILLTGCSNDGAGGPIISSLSTPTDATAGVNSPPAPNSERADSEGVSFDGETDPVITMTPTQNGVTAHLTWDQPSDIKVDGYYIYYGKRSSQELSSQESRSEKSSSEEPVSEESGSEEPSSCSSGESQAVEAPTATITGLEPNTSYFFAIRAFNESESLCSNEIVAVTPPAQS